MENQVLEKLLNDRLEPINKKMIEQEKERHKQFLDRFFEKYNDLGDKHDSYRSQIITLEGVIFGAIVVLSNPAQVTPWLISALCAILISMIFGLISKNLSMQAAYQNQESDYYNEMQHHWWIRELWKDDGVKAEKDLIGTEMKNPYEAVKTKLSYKLLKLLKLNADRIENTFFISFIVALVFLMFHLLSRISPGFWLCLTL